MEKINERLYSWASILGQRAREQAERAARLTGPDGEPLITGHVALMPDAHLGKGATVGSVIPTESAIIPAAVGVDLGCGMIASRLSLTAADLPDTLTPMLGEVAKAIPAGFAKHADATKPAWRWLVANPVPRPSELSESQHRKIGAQLGTLGGGNHFVEVCLDEVDGVWAVLHSGSRGIGNTLATRHIQRARALCT